MKLFENQEHWNELMGGGATPSVTLRAGVSDRLALVPYLRERVKLHLRAFVHRGHTERWLHLLNSHPAFSDYARQCPRLLHKIYRPYLTARLAMDDRLALLASHYQFMFRHGLAQLVGQASRGGLLLASVEGKSGTRFQFHLRAIEPMDREGELVLQMRQGSTLVYSIAFTFSELEGSAMVSIGCIQGAKRDDALSAIREATRELHGVRPKQLMVGLVRHLGAALGCRQMRLVGNANRVVRGAMREGRVLADYEQLWTELGAERRGDGDFQIDCAPIAPLDLERISSKKRSEARKRHQLSVELAGDIARHFCLRPDAVTKPARIA
jgi:uncharacterized protein VirK/YbjX